MGFEIICLNQNVIAEEVQMQRNWGQLDSFSCSADKGGFLRK